MPDRLEFALLKTFRRLFEGTQYKHRDSSLGDLVASQLYEDLVALDRSVKLVARVQAHEPQRHALGFDRANALRLSADRSGQRMALAPSVLRAQRPGAAAEIGAHASVYGEEIR